MNNNDKKILAISALSDVVTVLKTQGKTPEQLAAIVIKLIGATESGVIDRLMEKMPEDKLRELDAMLDQKKSAEEINKLLTIDEEEVRDIEIKEFIKAVRLYAPEVLTVNKG